MNALDRFDVYRVIAPAADPDEAWEALREAFIDRIEEMNVSRLAIDEAGGFAAGHSSKILCTPPIKDLGPKSLSKMMMSTGTALVMVVDTDRAARLEATMEKRRRRHLPAAAASIPPNAQEMADLAAQLVKDHMRKIGEKGNKMGAASNGGKRRAKAMSRRARQRVASHAARMRWSKRNGTVAP